MSADGKIHTHDENGHKRRRSLDLHLISLNGNTTYNGVVTGVTGKITLNSGIIDNLVSLKTALVQSANGYANADDSAALHGS